jgi:hypothetical protein
MVDPLTKEYLRELSKAIEANRNKEVTDVNSNSNDPISELQRRSKALESTLNNWESLVAKEAKRMEREGFVSESEARQNKLMSLQKKLLDSRMY